MRVLTCRHVRVVFLTISMLLAVALEPFVAWMGRRNVSRALSVSLLALLLLALIAVGIGVVLPPLADQLGDLVTNFPAFRARVEHRLPQGNFMLRTVVDQIFELPSSPEVLASVHEPLIWGRANGLGGHDHFLRRRHDALSADRR